MRLQGQYRIKSNKSEKPLILPNLITNEGEASFLRMIVQADNVDVPSGGNWFVGLIGNNALDETSVLVDITDEVPVLNNYARQPILRNATGWPTITQVDPHHRALSASVDFEATGGDFANTYTRVFLCNVVSGTTGILYSVSAAAPAAIQISDTEIQSISYELFLS